VREDLEILYTTEASVTVEAIGGEITIDSSAGSGTCIVVTIRIATEPDRRGL
jgi:signal transduction histidine kinase